MYNSKKKFLKRYLLQQTKFNRYKNLHQLTTKQKNSFIKICELSQQVRDEIEKKIAALDDELLSELLYEKYILGRTLEEIALGLNYSKRHIERLHIKALEKIDI